MNPLRFPPDRAIRNIAVLLSGILMLRYLLFIATADIPALVAAPTDDSYYYLEIASNLVSDGRPTFDGRHLTNGFHPLWGLSITPVFVVFQSKIAALRAVSMFSVFLFSVSLALAHRSLFDLNTQWSALVGLVGTFYFINKFITYNMETAIVVPVGMALLYYVLLIDVWSLEEIRPRQLLVVGLLMGGFQLGRLDAVFLNVLLVSTVFVKNRHFLTTSEGIRQFGTMIAGPGLSGAGYIAYNLAVFGHIFPVSGAVKSQSGIGINTNVFAQLSLAPLIIVALILFVSVVTLVEMPFPEYSVARDHDTKRIVRRLVAGFVLIHFCYYLFFHEGLIEIWYLYPYLLASVWVIPGTIERLLGLVEALGASQSIAIEQWVTYSARVLSLLAIVILIVFVAPTAPVGDAAETHYQYRNYQMAEFTSSEIEDDVMIAMGDQAGSFGYFADQSVVHLEGLANSYSIIDYIEDDALGEYMSAQGVEYLADVEAMETDSYRQAVVGPTHEQKIGVTHITVYEQCEVYEDGRGQNRFIWSWSCIRKQ